VSICTGRPSFGASNASICKLVGPFPAYAGSFESIHGGPTSKLVEKYDVDASAAWVSAGGGEYPLQDGFGWTNGVLRVLLALYPGVVNLPDTKPAALVH
jgi:hypothetical protein